MATVVIGLGAVGTFLFTLLSGRSDTYAISRSAVSEKFSIEGATTIEVRARDNIWRETESVELPPGSIIFVATKAHQLVSVADMWAQKIPDDATLVFVQNGLGISELAMKLFPKGKMLRMTCRFGVRLLQPGAVALAGSYAASLAPVRGSMGDVTRVAKDLRQVGFTIHETGNPAAIEWEKAILNLVTNPLGVICNIPNGEITSHEALTNLATRIAEEGIAVAKALSIPLPFSNATQVLALIAPVASNLNSHLVDHLLGRDSDMEYLLGQFTARAKEVGVSVPVADTLWGSIDSLLGVVVRREFRSPHSILSDPQGW